MKLFEGQTSLTVAAPGAGKSQFWANLVQQMQLPTVYWSADTDQQTVTHRTLQMWLGVDNVEEKLKDPVLRDDLFTRLRGRSDHIDWVFDSTITDKAVGERLEAFAEVNGRYPSIFVVDNLRNAVEDVDKQGTEIQQIMTAMQKLARETRTHIAVLAHANGKYEDGTMAIPQSGALYNPFATVELGITMYRPRPDALMVNIVKNRSGPSDPKALNARYLQVDFAHAKVHGYT